jgi:hypothetical protein
VAVDASRKTNPYGLVRRGPGQPPLHLARERFDVSSANLIDIRAQHPHRRSKEAIVDRIRIRATNELKFDDVVRRNHPRIAGMELCCEPFGLQPLENQVNARSHKQHRTLLTLGQEIAHRPV